MQKKTMHPSGKVGRFQMDNQSPPPRNRKRYPTEIAMDGLSPAKPLNCPHGHRLHRNLDRQPRYGVAEFQHPDGSNATPGSQMVGGGTPKIQPRHLTIDDHRGVHGDSSAAVDRLKLLNGIPLVILNSEVDNLANLILSNHMMPQKAAADAVHVAAAAIAGVNYLLTQNCKHIANAHELPRVYRLLDDQGYGQLLICTPTEFLGGENENDDEKPDT